MISARIESMTEKKFNKGLTDIANHAAKAFDSTYDRNKYCRDQLLPFRGTIKIQADEAIEKGLYDGFIYSACNGVALLNSASKEKDKHKKAMMLDQAIFLGDEI